MNVHALNGYRNDTFGHRNTHTDLTRDEPNLEQDLHALTVALGAAANLSADAVRAFLEGMADLKSILRRGRHEFVRISDEMVRMSILLKDSSLSTEESQEVEQLTSALDALLIEDEKLQKSYTVAEAKWAEAKIIQERAAALFSQIKAQGQPKKGCRTRYNDKLRLATQDKSKWNNEHFQCEKEIKRIEAEISHLAQKRQKIQDRLTIYDHKRSLPENQADILRGSLSALQNRRSQIEIAIQSTNTEMGTRIRNFLKQTYPQYTETQFDQVLNIFTYQI